MSSTRKTKQQRHAVGAKAAAVSKPGRHNAAPAGEAKRAANGDDTAVSAALERDVDSTDATRLETIFEEPSHVDDDAIVDDADSTGSSRR